MIEIINGDLLDAKEQCIAHQANCLSENATGVAKAIFDRFPYSNTYKRRIDNSIKDTPGTISIHGDGKDQRYIINMYSQYYPGRSKYIESKLDGVRKRLNYFNECLVLIADIKNLQSIAFPYLIGCGYAKGNWDDYLKLLNSFAKYTKNKYNTKTVLYRKN